MDELPDFRVPLDIDPSGVKFAVRLSPCSPLNEREGKRAVYSDWVMDDDIVNSKGLYIWLLPRSTGLRFLHVGISEKGSSSLTKRTKAHCYNAFVCDPLYGYDPSQGDFGLLGERVKEKSEDLVVDFLKQIRVLFLIDKGDGVQLIRQLEGALARCADDAYRSIYRSRIVDTVEKSPGRGFQITNTLSKVRSCSGGHMMHIRDELNRVIEVLPGG